MEKTIHRTTYCLVVFFLFLHSSFAQTDINWLRKIHSNENQNAQPLMYDLSQTTYPVAALLPTTEIIYGYLKHDKKIFHNGISAGAGLCMSAIVVYGLKYSTNRNRPYDTYPDIIPYYRENDPSFPSGHTSFAFATATNLSLHYPKWYIIAPAYIWAGAIGYSRLYMGLHYPSDVIVGALVGASSAYLTHKGQQWLIKRKANKRKKIE